VEKNAFYRVCSVATIKGTYAYLFIHIVVCTVDIINERFVPAQYVETKSAGSAVVVVQGSSE
jgi:hypothetical protein